MSLNRDLHLAGSNECASHLAAAQNTPFSLARAVLLPRLADAPSGGYRAPLPGLAVTVRDTQLSQVRAELSRHGEHPGVSVGMAERRDGLACWQLLLTVSGSSANLWSLTVGNVGPVFVAGLAQPRLPRGPDRVLLAAAGRGGQPPPRSHGCVPCGAGGFMPVS
jgi:hypothetical protein